MPREQGEKESTGMPVAQQCDLGNGVMATGNFACSQKSLFMSYIPLADTTSIQNVSACDSHNPSHTPCGEGLHEI